MKFVENFNLKSFNSFGVEAHASKFYEFRTQQELVELLNDIDASGELLILGGGSNILFLSSKLGQVAFNRIRGKEIIEKEGETIVVRVGAGENWHQFVRYCISQNYGGLENLSLIPGTVGAAPMQNIGAYGVEQEQYFVELEAVERSTGNIRTFNKSECKFGYRESIFKNEERDKYVITSVTYRLTLTDHQLHLDYGAINETLERNGITTPTINDVSDAVIKIRQTKLPDPAVIGNAGSFFKNPTIDFIDYEGLKLEFPEIPGYKLNAEEVKVPAAWLIDQCGWKGKRFGDIGVHENQALVIVNYGRGTGQQILELSKKIQASVADQYGIELEREVNIV